MTSTKDANDLVRKLKKLGWAHENKRGGIHKMTFHTGESITIPNSPSCHRGMKNKISQIRKIDDRI